MNQATAHAPRPETAEVLSKAVRNAGRALGLSQSEVGVVIGKARSSLARPLDPATKSGELAALLVRCYRSVFVLTGGNEEAMRHWMATENRHTGGVPREQVKEVAGLIAVVGYLEVARGKL